MRRKITLVQRVLTLALIVGIIAAAGVFTAPSANAQAPTGGTPPAKDADWAVSITYQNTGNAATPVTVLFYPEGSANATPYDPRAGLRQR
jgi:hypothetical protein